MTDHSQDAGREIPKATAKPSEATANLQRDALPVPPAPKPGVKAEAKPEVKPEAKAEADLVIPSDMPSNVAAAYLQAQAKFKPHLEALASLKKEPDSVLGNYDKIMATLKTGGPADSLLT